MKSFILICAICIILPSACYSANLDINAEVETTGLFSDLSASNPHTFAVKSLHPIVNYFDYLSIFGVWGDVLKYLIEDDRAFGRHVAYVDECLKDMIGDEQRYKTIVRRTLRDYKPLVKAFSKLNRLLPSAFDVKSRRTGRTFGDALKTLSNISDQIDISDELLKRLNSYDGKVEPNDSVHIRITEELLGSDMWQRGKQLAENVLRRPLELNMDFPNLSQFERLPMTVAQMLASVNFDTVLLLIREWTIFLTDLYDDYVQDGMRVLDRLYDPRTGLSMGKSLDAILNALNQPENLRKLSTIMNNVRRDVFRQPKKYISKALDVVKRLGMKCPCLEKLATQLNQAAPSTLSNIPSANRRTTNNNDNKMPNLRNVKPMIGQNSLDRQDSLGRIRDSARATIESVLQQEKQQQGPGRVRPDFSKGSADLTSLLTSL